MTSPALRRCPEPWKTGVSVCRICGCFRSMPLAMRSGAIRGCPPSCKAHRPAGGIRGGPGQGHRGVRRGEYRHRHEHPQVQGTGIPGGDPGGLRQDLQPAGSLGSGAAPWQAGLCLPAPGSAAPAGIRYPALSCPAPEAGCRAVQRGTADALCGAHPGTGAADPGGDRFHHPGQILCQGGH